MKRLYNGGLRLWTLTALLAAAGLTACSDDDGGGNGGGGEEPPVELDNQILCDGETVDIRSAVWEAGAEGGYVFYLSPRAGIVRVEDMLQTDDYLEVGVADPKGTVDVAKDPFHIRYKTLFVDDMTMSAEAEEVELQADLAEGTSMLDLSVHVLMKAQQGGGDADAAQGCSLTARYNGVAAETLPVTLNRQWQLNREVTAIGSVLEWRHAGRNVYYLCDRADVDTPPSEEAGVRFVRISVDPQLTGEIDLAAADPEQVSVTCGELSTATAAAVGGTLRISKDKTGRQLTVSLESRIDGEKLRAAYTGAYTAGYESADFFRVTTPEGEVFESPLRTVFRKEPHEVTQFFAMGDAENPAAPAELVEGRYALQFNVTRLDAEHDAGTSTQYSLKLFDYADYRTWDAAKGAEGKLETRQPNADDERVYLRFDITFPDGMHAEGEWYGTLTAAEEEFDLTPVRPFRPYFQILSKDKEVLELDITALEVRKETTTVEGTGPYTLWYFYFRNANTEVGSNVDESNTTPCLYVMEEQIGAGVMNIPELKGKPCGTSTTSHSSSRAWVLPPANGRTRPIPRPTEPSP